MRTTGLQMLQAHQQGDGSQPQLARRFRVSVSHVQKIHRQWRRSGKMEPIPPSSWTQAQVQRGDSPATSRLVAAVAGFNPGGVAREASPAGPARGEPAGAVGGAAKDGIAAEKSHCMRKNVTPRQTGSVVRGARKSLPGQRRRSCFFRARAGDHADDAGLRPELARSGGGDARRVGHRRRCLSDVSRTGAASPADGG